MKNFKPIKNVDGLSVEMNGVKYTLKEIKPPLKAIIFKSNKKCHHKEGPVGYFAKDTWLEWMSKRFIQLKCPICGLYKIWKRKVKK